MKMMISMAFLASVASLQNNGTGDETTAPSSNVLLRKDLNFLSQDEENNLKGALRRMQQDKGRCGFEFVAGFHGAPLMCKTYDHQKTECSIHAKFTFPHWHRLITVQFEQCLRKHGQSIGVPYWDLTSPGQRMPRLVTGDDNPFSSYTIRFKGEKTVRDPTEALFDTNNAEGTCLVYQLFLIVLEQRDYCSYEKYMESLHNAVHPMIGGTNSCSLRNTVCAAFDPMFMILHSTFDRVWIVWQQLQKRRDLPFDSTVCDGRAIHKTLHPFDDPEINIIPLTRENCFSGSITDHHHLQYRYDKLVMNNYNVEKLDEIIKRKHSETRVYLGQANFGGQPLRTETFVLNDAGEQFPAGTNFMMGNSEDTHWYNRPLFKFDITNAVRQAGVPLNRNIKFLFRIETYKRSFVANVTDYAIFYIREAYADYEIINIPIGVSYQLPAKIEVFKKTRIRFLPVSKKFVASMVDMVSDTDFKNCALPQPSFDSYTVNVIHPLQPRDYYFASSNKEACDGGKKIIVRVQHY